MVNPNDYRTHWTDTYSARWATTGNEPGPLDISDVGVLAARSPGTVRSWLVRGGHQFSKKLTNPYTNRPDILSVVRLPRPGEADPPALRPLTQKQDENTEAKPARRKKKPKPRLYRRRLYSARRLNPALAPLNGKYVASWKLAGKELNPMTVDALAMLAERKVGTVRLWLTKGGGTFTKRLTNPRTGLKDYLSAHVISKD